MAAFAFVSLDRQSCTVSRVRECFLLNCTLQCASVSSTTPTVSFFKHELPFAHFGENRLTLPQDHVIATLSRRSPLRSLPLYL